MLSHTITIRRFTPFKIVSMYLILPVFPEVFTNFIRRFKKISLAKTAALAAYAHGKAGEAAEEKSSASYVTASEIIRGLKSI